MILGFLVLTMAWLTITVPHNDRDWTEDQKRLAWADVRGSVVHLNNVRDFRYRSDEAGDWSPAWYAHTFDLNQLRRAYFFVDEFYEASSLAHTMVSFEFAEATGPRFVVFSVEIRKEKGEQYSPIKGLFRNYEIQYVIADEQDSVKLRSVTRGDKVYMYEIKRPVGQLRAFFMDMVKRLNALKKQPEFYNTLWNNCTTNLVNHFETVSEHDLGFDYRILLPAYSANLAYELGLLDRSLPYETLRKKSLITRLARKHANDEDFSLRIRHSLRTR
ncbi:MAG: DUF4105 domain-containing protein [Myxococcales bacterium]|nr:MAG: DUF4105 domain-containing protein [Myxococcales bacterium]